MRKTKWIFRQGENSQDVSLNLDRDILTVLSNRGIAGKDNIEKFIAADLKDIDDPLGLEDMEKSVERLLEAKEKKENIWVYGDYDVDGITSVSMVYLALKELGFNISYYIPLRDEGYGLNRDALTHISEQKGDIVITVDCGISSHGEIEHANQLGLQVIVTDHHEINHGCPPAYGVINPKREENRFPFRSLAGVGTAFMMVLALYRKLGRENEAYKFLDIVAIGTVADIVPLVEENRIFVKHGLQLLRHSSWKGLRVLLREIYENYTEKDYTPYDVGFVIAPIFNAAGRLEDAKMAVEIFIGEDLEYLHQRAKVLIAKNNERKEIQEDILEKCQRAIEEENLGERSTIVVAGKEFHHGVIGIVASKLMDQYYRPIVVMEIKEDEGIAVASCRSIESFNMVEALNTMSELFLKYGGHAAAAGFSIPIENIEIFKDKLEALATEGLSDADFYRSIKIDKELPLYKLNYELLDKLSLLEPYGFGNPSPLFMIKNCTYKNMRLIGKEKNHLMMDLLKGGLEIKNAVWFGAQDMFEYIVENRTLDVVCKLKLESYKDRYQIKAFIEDVKGAGENSEDPLEQYFRLREIRLPMEAVIYTRKQFSGKNLSLSFGEMETNVIENRDVIGNLDAQTSYIVKKLKELYGFRFRVELKEIVKKDENYNVHILIERDYSFTSYSLKAGELFREIKTHLLGRFEYNSLQKKVLSSIFKDKKNTWVKAEKGRGIATIIRTLDLYCLNTGKKLLLLTKENGESYREGYDYYIYIDRHDVEQKDGITLVFSQDNMQVENFSEIEDSYILPPNVKIVENERALFGKADIYSGVLPYEMRHRIYENMDRLKEIYATEDIKILF